MATKKHIIHHNGPKVVKSDANTVILIFESTQNKSVLTIHLTLDEVKQLASDIEGLGD